jgi:hypothetical protein
MDDVEMTPVANAKFSGLLADEIVRLNRIIREQKTMLDKFYIAVKNHYSGDDVMMNELMFEYQEFVKVNQ